MHVVREEPLRVQDCAKPLRTRLDRHSLAVLVTVHLDDGVEALFEGVAIGGEANDREDDAAGGVVGADAEELGNVAGVDVVTRGGAGVAGEDGEGAAGYAEGGAAVVGVAVMREIRGGSDSGMVLERVFLTGRKHVVLDRMVEMSWSVELIWRTSSQGYPSEYLFRPQERP